MKYIYFCILCIYFSFAFSYQPVIKEKKAVAKIIKLYVKKLKIPVTFCNTENITKNNEINNIDKPYEKEGTLYINEPPAQPIPLVASRGINDMHVNPYANEILIIQGEPSGGFGIIINYTDQSNIVHKQLPFCPYNCFVKNKFKFHSQSILSISRPKPTDPYYQNKPMKHIFVNTKTMATWRLDKLFINETIINTIEYLNNNNIYSLLRNIYKQSLQSRWIKLDPNNYNIYKKLDSNVKKILDSCFRINASHSEILIHYLYQVFLYAIPIIIILFGLKLLLTTH